MEDQKPWPGLARNQNFAEGRGLEPKLKSENVKSRDVGSILVSLKRITDGGLGAKPPAAGRFLEIFW